MPHKYSVLIIGLCLQSCLHPVIAPTPVMEPSHNTNSQVTLDTQKQASNPSKLAKKRYFKEGQKENACLHQVTSGTLNNTSSSEEDVQTHKQVARLVTNPVKSNTITFSRLPTRKQEAIKRRKTENISAPIKIVNTTAPAYKVKPAAILFDYIQAAWLEAFQQEQDSLSLSKQSFVAKGGHIVQFYRQDNEWLAEVQENLPIGFISNHHSLPVYLAPGMRLVNLLSYDRAWKKQCIHVHLNNRDESQTSHVYVGNMVLQWKMCS